MRIGYACINRSIGCTSSSTFRLKNFSAERFAQTVAANLECLKTVLKFNAEHSIGFFRISSDIIPFASHPVCTIDWVADFKQEFAAIGRFIKKQGMRVAMHPDQFTLLNSPGDDITRRSIAELDYHCRLLDALACKADAKVQIHVGGVYGERVEAMHRFCKRYAALPQHIKERLVIENDERSYSVKDCLEISHNTGIPVLFDIFHHECLNCGESIAAAFAMVQKTWKKRDGVPIVDYSSQKAHARFGSHAQSVDLRHFRQFTKQMNGQRADVMLEIKDKEQSVLKLQKIYCNVSARI